ncbi:MAG TPA: helix-turn-helix domain-containing protein [Solirubrobacterales bacterium]|nr:helix-turn-helix domain-containing protein [Solirubrobacterales bacterium]
MASFGENLRRERELRGVTLREIADATKISVRFLQALENDRVDALPGGLFRRTFVRQYARYVGLDPERMVAEFLYAHGDETPETVAARPRFSVSQGALSAAAVLLLVIWLAYPLARNAPEEEEAAAHSPATTVPREFVYPPAAPLPSSQPEATTAAAASDGLTLSLAAQQDCWVRVTVDGETVLDRVLTAGQRETLAAEGEIVLSVGNAGGVTFSVNDRPGVPLGKNGEVKKNIVITRQSLPSLVEQDPPSETPPSG